MQNSHKNIIGSNIFVDILGRHVPAKIDTGADSSAIWVSDIQVDENNVLKFKLFGGGSDFYNNKVLKRKKFQIVVVRNSHGEERICYRTHIPIKIDGQKINVLFTLSDRKNNNFPILIGRRTIKGKFIVDVSKQDIVPDKNPKTRVFNQELNKNPYLFHQKYAKEISGAKI